MVRIKKGVTARHRHRKILKLAKGYRMTRSRHFKKAQEAVLHAGQYAYDGRKLKKREFRRLWIMRINAAVKPYNLKYNRFIKNLKEKKVELDRKVLSQIAIDYPKIFEKIVSHVK